jgi:hypothetical protein
MPVVFAYLNEHSFVRRVVLCLAGLVLSLMVFFLFLRHPGIDSFKDARVVDMVYGRANRPYVLRALLPAAARLLVDLTPPSLQERIRETTRTNKSLACWFAANGWDPASAVVYLAVSVWIYACLVGFALLVGRLASALYSGPPLLIESTPLLALAFLPSLFCQVNYVYDPATLFFSTLCLVLMARRRLGWFLPCFAVACINKETAILQTLVFYLHFRQDDQLGRPRFRGMLLAQVAIFLAVKTTLSVIFRSNPGSFGFLLFFHNLGWRFNPVGLAGTLSYFVVGIMVVHHWSCKPKLLREAAWMLPILVLLGLLMGFVDEVRSYCDAYPVVVLLAIPSAAALAGAKMEAREEGPHDRAALGLKT